MGQSKYAVLEFYARILRENETNPVVRDSKPVEQYLLRGLAREIVMNQELMYELDNIPADKRTKVMLGEHSGYRWSDSGLAP